MTKFVQPLRSGQITIPVEFRKQLGIGKGTVLKLSMSGDELRIKPIHLGETVGGSAWMKDLYEMFAPVRSEIGKRRYSDREIDASISKAISAVRKKHASRP